MGQKGCSFILTLFPVDLCHDKRTFPVFLHRKLAFPAGKPSTGWKCSVPRCSEAGPMLELFSAASAAFHSVSVPCLCGGRTWRTTASYRRVHAGARSLRHALRGGVLPDRGWASACLSLRALTYAACGGWVVLGRRAGPLALILLHVAAEWLGYDGSRSTLVSRMLISSCRSLSRSRSTESLLHECPHSETATA